MPALICDLRPQAAELVAEYHQLRASGEALALFWPNAVFGPHPDWLPVRRAQELAVAWEAERIAVLAPGEPLLPPWLQLDDFHRLLLVSPAATRAALSPDESRLLDSLFAAGAEAVELLPAASARDLAQSWCSGRRAGAVILTD
ncbi:MAG TPA: hypothetical protein VNF74_14675 [Terriglobales bacterium]|nr:hypothetical protein [Terriglobales bacterium]